MKRMARNSTVMAVLGLLIVACVAMAILTPLDTIIAYRFAPHYPENKSETLQIKGLQAG